jgi:glutamyl-tRNA reductase
MKHIANEPYDKYITRVRNHELGIALQALANGDDPKLIAAAMSARIVDKALHPLYKKLNNPD